MYVSEIVINVIMLMNVTTNCYHCSCRELFMLVLFSNNDVRSSISSLLDLLLKVLDLPLQASHDLSDSGMNQSYDDVLLYHDKKLRRSLMQSFILANFL